MVKFVGLRAKIYSYNSSDKKAKKNLEKNKTNIKKL